MFSTKSRAGITAFALALSLVVIGCGKKAAPGGSTRRDVPSTTTRPTTPAAARLTSLQNGEWESLGCVRRDVGEGVLFAKWSIKVEGSVVTFSRQYYEEDTCISTADSGYAENKYNYTLGNQLADGQYEINYTYQGQNTTTYEAIWLSGFEPGAMLAIAGTQPNAANDGSTPAKRMSVINFNIDYYRK